MINLEFSGSLDDFFEGFIKLHQESPSLAWATLLNGTLIPILPNC